MIFLEKKHHENWKTCPRTQLLVTKTSTCVTCVLIQKHHISVTCRDYNPSYPVFWGHSIGIYTTPNSIELTIGSIGPPCRDFEQTSSDIPPQHLGFLLDILGELIVLPQPDLQSVKASKNRVGQMEITWQENRMEKKNTKKLLEILYNVSCPLRPPKKRSEIQQIYGGIFARKCCVERATFFGGLKGDFSESLQ